MDSKRTLKSEPMLLGGLLLADFVAASAVCWKIPFQAPTAEYMYPALELASKHRIASDFLPVGMSALLGLGAMLPNQRAGLTIVLVAISLALIAAAWAYLRAIGMSVRATFVLTALLSAYPDFLLSYDKLMDVNLTAFFLFSVMAAVLWVLRSPRVGWADVVLGLMLGAAVTVRTNLLLLLPLAWFLLSRYRVPSALGRAGIYIVGVVVVYAGVTAVVHGRPFLPHNGPYNLYAGANELTGSTLSNEEDSLLPELARHGIYAQPLHWWVPSDQPGVVDLRDRSLEPVYQHLAAEFVKAHPATMVKLAAWKVLTILRPDLRVHRLRSSGGLLKVFAACAFPLWLAGMIWLRHPEPSVGPAAAKWLVGLAVVLYLVPFALTVSPPRFGVPLEFLCWMDLGAMVVSRARGTRRYAA
jgi:hypothetical protein